MQKYNKAWAALITGTVTIAAAFGFDLEKHLSPELIASLATLLTGAMVWLVPNKPKP